MGLMRCPNCANGARYLLHPPLTGDVEYVCVECGNSGIAYCCEGVVEQPEKDDAERQGQG